MDEPVAPSPSPAPLPVTSAALRRRPRASLIAGVLAAALLLVCGCCVASAVLGPRILQPIGRTVEARVNARSFQRSMLPLQASWAGSGTVAVIQSAREDGLARVLVWERATARTRELDGWRVVATEEATPAAWLVRDSVDATPELFGWQYPGGELDTSVPGLWRLDLRGTVSTPSAVTSAAEWVPWSGAAGFVAHLTAVATAGACPSRLTFSSGSRSWQAPLPLGVTTIRPIGWSPSGRSFAAIGYVRLTNRSRFNSPGELIVFDAETGSSQEWRPQDSESEGSTFRWVWDPKEDRLFWFGRNTASVPSELAVCSFEGDGQFRKASDWAQSPESWPTGTAGVFAGTGPSGAVLFVSGEPNPFTGSSSTIWNVDSRRAPERAGRVVTGFIPPLDVRYSPEGGLLWNEMSTSNRGGLIKRVVVAGVDGSNRRTIHTESVANPGLQVLGIPDPTGGR